MSSAMGMAFKSLRRRKLRTAFTVSGIVVGVALILVLLSLSAGTSSRAGGLINTLSPAQITVVNATGRTAATTGGGGTFVFRGAGGGGFGGGGGFPGGGAAGSTATFASLFGDSTTLEQAVVDAVGNLTGVSVASPTLSSTGYVNGTAAFLTGIDPETYNAATGGLNIVDGTNLANSTSGSQIVVGQTLASNLGLAVGSTVLVGSNTTGGSPFTVVGIYSTGNTFTERFSYIPLDNAQAISNKTGQVSEIFVKADSPNEVSQVTAEISASFPGVSAIAPSTFTDAAASLSGTLTSFFTVVGLAALLAGGFGVVNTMMMSISERTREIGAMKAIGAKKGQIMRIFLSEAFLIGVIGGLIGVAIGVGVSLALPYLTGAASSSSVGGAGAGFGGLFRGALSPKLTLNTVLLSLGLGVVVGILSGVYPAWRASKMDPVEALRHV
jgi:putative ABC transport system permease protein